MATKSLTKTVITIFLISLQWLTVTKMLKLKTNNRNLNVDENLHNLLSVLGELPNACDCKGTGS